MNIPKTGKKMGAFEIEVFCASLCEYHKEVLESLPIDVRNYIYGIGDVGWDESRKRGELKKRVKDFGIIFKKYPILQKAYVKWKGGDNY